MTTTIAIDRRTVTRLSLPQKVRGRYRTIKTVVAAILLTFFFVTPLLRWDRGAHLPDQAVLFDLSGRRLFIFGLEFWPQDLPIAVGALILGAFGLFYATTLAGRVWCGFTCPQTVWTDLFYGVDRLTERLVGRGSIASKVLRNFIWVTIAVLTGVGFAAYFNDALTFPIALVTGTAPVGAYVTIGVLTLTTWLLAGYARERVCLHMCPWPRFQAALLDRDSLVVTYQKWRGEPRGKKKAPIRTDLLGLSSLVREEGAFDGGRGDCIDCYRCVSVCPTGVDIREGLQMGCIGCGLCIDACDEIMTKVDRPKGLIRFDVEGSEARRGIKQPGMNLLRPKSILYALFCLIALGGMAYGITSMANVMVEVEPQRNPPFIQLSDGAVRNDYTLRLAHRLGSLDRVKISSSGIPGAVLRLGSTDDAGLTDIEATIGEARQLSDRLFVVVPAGHVPAGRTPLHITFSDPVAGTELGKVDTYFWGPGQ